MRDLSPSFLEKFQKNDNSGGNRQTLADRVESFRRFRLHVDPIERDAKQLCEIVPNPFLEKGKPWPLQFDYTIHINDARAFQRGELQRFREKETGILTRRNLRFGIAFPDVPQSAGAQQRVDKRVQQHIAVGNSVNRKFTRDVDAPKAEAAPTKQSMDIRSHADSEFVDAFPPADIRLS